MPDRARGLARRERRVVEVELSGAAISTSASMRASAASVSPLKPRRRADVVRVVGVGLAAPVERRRGRARRVAFRPRRSHRSSAAATRIASSASGVRGITQLGQRHPQAHRLVARPRLACTRHRRTARAATSRSSSCDQRARARHRRHRDDALHAAGWLTAHCSACMPPIDAPTTAYSRPTSECSSRRRCDSTMSRSVMRGNAQPAGARCSTARSTGRCRARRRRRCSGGRCRARVPAADQEVEPVVRAADRRADEDRRRRLRGEPGSPWTTYD